MRRTSKIKLAGQHSKIGFGLALAAAIIISISAICVFLFGMPPPTRPPTDLQNDELALAYQTIAQRWSAIGTVVMTLVSVATLILLAWTLRITRGLLKAATDANLAVLRVGETQTQAYLDICGASATYYRVAKDKLDLVTDVRVEIKNFGQSPAYQCSIVADYRIVEDTDHFSDPQHPPIGPNVTKRIFKNLSSGDSYNGIRFEPNKKIEVHFGKRLEVWGEVRYRTVYGHLKKTQFTYAFLPSQLLSITSKLTGDAVAVKGMSIGFDELAVFADVNEDTDV